MEVSVWMKPSIKDITSFKFEIGETLVTYFAQDAFHNKGNCSFFVIIKGIILYFFYAVKKIENFR